MSVVPIRIPLVDLVPTADERSALLEAISAVIDRGWFVLGPEVSAFESELAQASGAEHAVGLASGTDALIIALRCLGVGAGDEVIVPAMTAFPTAAAVFEVGARPVLVDVEPERPMLDLSATLAAITPSTRAVILVHLYGRTGDTRAFVDALAPRGIAVIEDCAQAQGATLVSGEPVGTVGVVGALSFYPTKNLGALGDGGALLTNDEAIAAEARAWRSHGERDVRYVHALPARNARLDDIQAAALRVRLRRLPRELSRRRELSARYAAGLPESMYCAHGNGGAPHLAVVTVDDRTSLAGHLAALGIGSGQHYPRALTQQPVFAALAPQAAPHAERWASRCLSLPLHSKLSDADLDEVIAAVVEHEGSR